MQIRKKVTLIALLGASILTASPAEHKKLALVSSLPHPMKMIMNNSEKLNISDAQFVELSKVLEHAPQKMHTMFDEAQVLEKEIQKAVMKEHKTPQELKSKLDEIAKLKRDITETQIETLNTLHTILNKEQIQKLYTMIKKQQNRQK